MMMMMTTLVGRLNLYPSRPVCLNEIGIPAIISSYVQWMNLVHDDMENNATTVCHWRTLSVSSCTCSWLALHTDRMSNQHSLPNSADSILHSTQLSKHIRHSLCDWYGVHASNTIGPSGRLTTEISILSFAMTMNHGLRAAQCVWCNRPCRQAYILQISRPTQQAVRLVVRLTQYAPAAASGDLYKYCPDSECETYSL